MPSIQAVRTGAYVADRLKGVAAPARLIATFERYAYLKLEIENDTFVVAFSRSDSPSGPLTIAIEPWPVWSRLLQTDGRLDGSVIRLDDLSIGLDTAEIWPSAAPSLRHKDPRQIATDLTRLAKSLPHHSEALSGVLLGNDKASFPGFDLGALSAGLLRQDAATTAEGAKGLIGLGQGLTPSGDDFLCGVMTALWVFADAPQTSCAAIASAAPRRTTSLSLAFLDAAAAGHVNQQWQTLLVAVGDGLCELELVKLLSAVMAMGHSSGADTLAGFIWASRLLNQAKPAATIEHRAQA